MSEEQSELVKSALKKQAEVTAEATSVAEQATELPELLQNPLSEIDPRKMNRMFDGNFGTGDTVSTAPRISGEVQAQFGKKDLNAKETFVPRIDSKGFEPISMTVIRHTRRINSRNYEITDFTATIYEKNGPADNKTAIAKVVASGHKDRFTQVEELIGFDEKGKKETSRIRFLNGQPTSQEFLDKSGRVESEVTFKKTQDGLVPDEVTLYSKGKKTATARLEGDTVTSVALYDKSGKRVEAEVSYNYKEGENGPELDSTVYTFQIDNPENERKKFDVTMTVNREGSRNIIIKDGRKVIETATVSAEEADKLVSTLDRDVERAASRLGEFGVALAASGRINDLAGLPDERQVRPDSPHVS